MKSSFGTPKSRYRSVKYKLSRQNTTSFHNLSQEGSDFLVPKDQQKIQLRNRQKINFTEKMNRSNSEYQKKLNEDEFNEKKFMKSTYINTFHDILSMEKGRRDSSLQKPQVHKKMKDPRVYLPVLNETDSFFTVLDNINLPISYIKTEIDKVSEGIKEEEKNMQKIRISLKQIEKKITNEIEETKKMGVKGFEKLRILLKSNKVVQQQMTMKAKNSFEAARTYLPNFNERLQKSKKDCQSLQKVIFANCPFELQQEEKFEIISSDYF